MNDVVETAIIARGSAKEFSEELSRVLRERGAVLASAKPEIHYSYAIEGVTVYTALIVWREQGVKP